MKRKLVVLLLTVGMITAGCGSQAEPASSSTPAAAESVAESVAEEVEETALQEADITDAVTGIADHTIVVDAENIDYTHNVLYDDEIVTAIEVDDSQVDLTTPGTYQVTYTVSVNTKALEDYKTGSYESANAGTSDTEASDTADVSTEPAEEPENAAEDIQTAGETEAAENVEDTTEEAVEESTQEGVETDASEAVSEEPAESAEEPSEPVDPGNVEVIEIVKDITVVDREEAVKQADEDQVVWDSENTTVSKSDGTEVVEPEPETPKSNTDKGTTPASAAKPAEAPGESVAEAAESDAEAEESKETAVETTEEKTSEKTTGTATTGSTTSNSSSKSNSTKNTTSSPGKSSSSTSTAHTHTWTTVNVPAETHAVYHEAVTHTVHHDAVTHEEAVYSSKNYAVCNTCGATYETGAELDDHQGSTGFEHGGYHIITKQIQTGTKTVTDQAAYDETVVDQAAYTETVVDKAAYTYQKCTGCGATK